MNFNQYEKEFMDFEKFVDFLKEKLILDASGIDDFFSKMTSSPQVQNKIYAFLKKHGTTTSQKEMAQEFTGILIGEILTVANKNEYTETPNLEHALKVIVPVLMSEKVM
jgi:hypothetical protein